MKNKNQAISNEIGNIMSLVSLCLNIAAQLTADDLEINKPLITTLYNYTGATSAEIVNLTNLLDSYLDE